MTAFSFDGIVAPAAASPAKRRLFSRLWPFRGSRIHHRTFGTLRPYRNGQFWRGKVQFAPAGHRVGVCIHAGHAGPTDAQERVYQQIEKHYAALLPHILAAMLPEYHKVRRAQPAARWPEAAEPGDLLKVLSFGCIWLEQGAGHPFVLSYQSDRDKNHEFHVFFREGRVVNVAFEE
ncbi:MAG: hypothetical protein JWN24_1706 [Phycisphaerales bacterium]|nr:hypothetical protein [Phycisphaerales bacterium]